MQTYWDRRKDTMHTHAHTEIEQLTKRTLLTSLSPSHTHTHVSLDTVGHLLKARDILRRDKLGSGLHLSLVPDKGHSSSYSCSCCNTPSPRATCSTLLLCLSMGLVILTALSFQTRLQSRTTLSSPAYPFRKTSTWAQIFTSPSKFSSNRI